MYQHDYITIVFFVYSHYSGIQSSFYSKSKSEQIICSKCLYVFKFNCLIVYDSTHKYT